MKIIGLTLILFATTGCQRRVAAPVLHTPLVSFPGEVPGSLITITGAFAIGLVIGAKPDGEYVCAYWDERGGWGCNKKGPQ